MDTWLVVLILHGSGESSSTASLSLHSFTPEEEPGFKLSVEDIKSNVMRILML